MLLDQFQDPVLKKWQLLLSPHSGITWCLMVAVNGQWVNQWTNEKIFMVKPGFVAPSLWQSTVVVNPAPEQGTW